jgi:uncharacterized membrane protein HdeD (DUF308 family)
LTKNWWLLALCGVLEAAYSAMNFFMQRPDGSLTLRAFAREGTVRDMGMLALAAGACTVAASLWRSSNGKSWFLALNGFAFTALGLIFTFWSRAIAFRTIASLIVVMAMSAGGLALASTRTVQHSVTDRRLLSLAGVVSVGFALVFLAFVLHWIKLNPRSPTQTLFWMGSYFAFNAVSLLFLALRLHRLGRSQFGRWESLPGLGNPKHAH